MIINTGFETNTSGWVSDYGSMSRDNDPVYAGSWSLRIDSEGTVTHTAGVSTEAITGINPSAYYDYYIAIRSDNGAPMYVYLKWYDGGSLLSSVTIASAYTSNSWHVYSGSSISPNIADRAKIVVSASNVENFQVHIDSVRLEYPSAPELPTIIFVPLFVSCMLLIIIVIDQ